MKKVLVIHGPNLNLLGKREADIYGTSTIEEINGDLVKLPRTKGAELETFQSNHEGEIVDKIGEAKKSGFMAIVINPAAFTHTSVAIRDALLLLDVPVIEVHLSNIYKREPFRHISYVADIATARVAGFGKRGYLIAMEAIAKMIENQ